MTIDAITIASFLKRYLPSVKSWGNGRRAREQMLMWLSWHFSRAHVCCIEEGGKPVAVGVARMVKHVDEARDRLASNENGKILYIDHAVAKTNESYKQLLRYCVQRWPRAERIAFHRNKSGSIMKTYDFKQFLQRAKV